MLAAACSRQTVALDKRYVHSAAATVDAYTLRLALYVFNMAESNLGMGRGHGDKIWRDEEMERRVGRIAADEVGADGKLCRGVQTTENSFEKEKPLAIVRPNNHLPTNPRWKDGGIARGQIHGL